MNQKINATRTNIKILLLRKGITQKQIAKKLGKSNGAISRLIAGDLKSPLLRKQFARVIGFKDPSELWPGKKAA